MDYNATNLKEEISKGCLLPYCSFCKNVPPGGINSGIIIKKTFICKKCEWEIVTAEIGEPKYDKLIDRLKELYRHWH